MRGKIISILIVLGAFVLIIQSIFFPMSMLEKAAYGLDLLELGLLLLTLPGSFVLFFLYVLAYQVSKYTLGVYTPFYVTPYLVISAQVINVYIFFPMYRKYRKGRR